VGEAPPKEHPPAQSLHIGQDRGAGGGKAADRLKKRIHIERDLPGEYKWQRADGGEHDPGQGHDHESVLDGAAAVLTPAQLRQKEAHGQGH